MTAALLAEWHGSVQAEREERHQRWLGTLRTLWSLHMTSWMLLADVRTDVYLREFNGDTMRSASTNARGMIAMTLGSLGLAPFVARAADALGRRALLLIGPTYCLLLRLLEIAFPKARTLALTHALSGPITMVPLAINTCIADLTIGDAARTGAEKARVMTGTYLAAVLGPLLGGTLAARGPRKPVSLSAAMSLLQVWLVLRHMPETSPARQRSQTSRDASHEQVVAPTKGTAPSGGLLATLRKGNRRLLSLLALQVLAFVSEPILVSRIGILVLTEALKWNTTVRARYATLEALLSIPAITISGRFHKRFGTATTLMLGSSAALSQHVLSLWVQEPWQQWIMPFVATLRGVSVAPLASLLQRAVEDAGITQAEFSGLSSALQALSMLTATIVWSAWFRRCTSAGKPRLFHLGPAAVAVAEMATGCLALRLNGS